MAGFSEFPQQKLTGLGVEAKFQSIFTKSGVSGMAQRTIKWNPISLDGG